uniref:PNPLA domain-containing protein n=1 Tax=viral metagenome TaxID=1070528 RepID=A0A6C0K0P0_9ZZZZ
MQYNIIRSLSINEFIRSSYVHPPEIDVVVSVGGFYGFFMIGVDKILKKLEQEGKLYIKRYAGSSCGAICSIMMACGVSSDEAIGIYNNLFRATNFFEKLREEILRVLPDDAYEICTDRVYIHCTELSWSRGLRHVVFSRFESNEDLVDAAMASSNFPFFISPRLWYPYRGKYYVDGCWSSPLPLFRDDSLHHQLVVKLYNIKYYRRYMRAPRDPSIEALVVKGAVETDKFLSGTDPHIETLCWYDPQVKQKKRKYYAWKASAVLLGSVTTVLTLFYIRQRNDLARIRSRIK